MQVLLDLPGKHPDKSEGECKKTLKRYGYLPGKQELATENILKQAKLLCRNAGISVA